ncbi:hypothetical protein ENSA5_35240 [Enhygromyxa salina]|uniref:Uncharacterized protein n=1 Tax=Enhygromyxa salina TaxID=215803 RepID=A0A2S9XVH9_9BACT|nr:hypothetical protein [Enhygromyxa salina]PRP96750.1 hypothetical protein ENSA5_35240 [Enhygromyxa salina]
MKTIEPCHGRLRAALLTLPLISLACADDAELEGGDDTSETDGPGDGDSGDGDGATGDGDGDPGDGDGDPGDGDGDKPGLGDTPNVLCEAATVNLEMIVAENSSGAPDPLAIEAAYVGTGLQEFVQQADAVTGRVDAGVLIDDAAILASLEDAIALGDPLDMLDIEWTIYLVMQQYIRHEVSDVAATLPDPGNDPALLYARWDDAWCYWDAGLRPIAQLADGVGLSGDSIEADIDAGFEWGHSGIEGEQPWAIDEWVVPPAKQVVEKSTYAIAHRLVMQWSADAATEGDPDLAAAQARAAYGAFQLIEDRMNSKNTPGIGIVETALLGDPALIDADDVLDQMNIAFVKRTRKYTDLALPDVSGLMGTAEGHTGANEGATYSKLVEPFMAELDGFDLDAYRGHWAAWIEAIVNDDLDAAESASAALTDYNCQLQAALGIVECTSAIDED